jgi:hypothetical protein
METASILLDHNDFPIKRKMSDRIRILKKALPQKKDLRAALTSLAIMA